MDTSRISVGEMIAAASALGLIIFLFLPWYGAEVAGVSDDASGWEAMSVIDILLFLCALATLGVVAARAAGAISAPTATILLGVGALALLLVVFRLIDIPEPEGTEAAEELAGEEVDFSRKIGLFLSLIAAGAMAYGGYRASSEATPGAAPGAGTPPPAPPPSQPPPPGPTA